MNWQAAAGAWLAIALVSVPPASGWTKETHLEIAKQAALIAPPDLLRLVKRHEQAFVRGVLAELGSDRHRAANADPTRSAAASARKAATAIARLTPFETVIEELGRLAVLTADSNHPLRLADGDPAEVRYRSDYGRYVGSAFARFPVVFYGTGRDLRSGEDVELLFGQTGRRGRRLYPMIGREYQRVGRIDGVREFDDRSTAFGVGSLSFSHSVSDLAALYRYVWLASGGADSRDLPLSRPGRQAAAVAR